MQWGIFIFLFWFILVDYAIEILIEILGLGKYEEGHLFGQQMKDPLPQEVKQALLPLENTV